jgi:hypothetical protein
LRLDVVAVVGAENLHVIEAQDVGDGTPIEGGTDRPDEVVDVDLAIAIGIEKTAFCRSRSQRDVEPDDELVDRHGPVSVTIAGAGLGGCGTG